MWAMIQASMESDGSMSLISASYGMSEGSISRGSSWARIVMLSLWWVGYLDSPSAAWCFTPGICSILNLYRRVFSFSFHSLVFERSSRDLSLVFSAEVCGRQQLLDLGIPIRNISLCLVHQLQLMPSPPQVHSVTQQRMWIGCLQGWLSILCDSRMMLFVDKCSASATTNPIPVLDQSVAGHVGQDIKYLHRHPFQCRLWWWPWISWTVIVVPQSKWKESLAWVVSGMVASCLPCWRRSWPDW